MIGTTELILINIFIICVISVIVVKLYYRKHADADTDIKIFNRGPDGGFFARKSKKETHDIINRSNSGPSYDNSQYYAPQSQSEMMPQKSEAYNPYQSIAQSQNPSPYNVAPTYANNNYHITPTKEGDNMENVEKTEKKDIATKIEQDESDRLVTTDQSTKKETYTEIAEDQPKVKDNELKDLFTIDELIKESKRKSKAAPSIKKPKAEDKKASKKDANPFLSQDEKEKMKDHIDEMESELKDRKAEEELDSSVKAVENETVENVLDNSKSPISTPVLKTPRKSGESLDDVVKETVAEKIDEYAPEVDQSTKKSTYTDIAEEQPQNVDQPLKDDLLEETTMNDSNLFEGEDEEYDELDYRKDLARITNKVKNSKLFSNVKNRLSADDEDEDPSIDEEFIRNVRSYDDTDEFEDAFKEDTEYEMSEDPYIRYEPEAPKIETAKDLHIKEIPQTDKLQLKINNNSAVLRKGDEIIYKYNGDTYSSKVFDIIGDDISVKFRGKYITIKPSDVKKIF